MSEVTDTLSADEKAYFDTRGEAEIAKPAPEPEAEAPEPEIIEDEGEEEVAVDPPKVPLAALTKERQAAKELKAKMADMEKRHAVLEDRWNTLLKVQEPEQKQQPVADDPMPDRNVDVFAFMDWQARQVEALKAKVTQRELVETQTAQHQREEQEIWSEWHQSATQFKAEKPDFDDAAKFLSNMRDTQLKGYAVLDERLSDQRARDAQINAELKEIIKAAKAKKVNPAEAVYQIAATYGYAAKAPVVADTEHLDQVERGMAGATSLSAVGGSRPGGALDAKSIADMAPEEFAKWLEKPGNVAKFRKIAGG